VLSTAGGEDLTLELIKAGSAKPILDRKG